jgi:hypothetical protein
MLCLMHERYALYQYKYHFVKLRERIIIRREELLKPNVNFFSKQIKVIFLIKH